MNKTIAKILFKIPFIRSIGKSQADIIIRAYKAAQANRFTYNWLVEYGSINKEIKQDYKALLYRARDLWNNNDYVRAYRNRIRVNIIGPDGVILQNRAIKSNGDEDDLANQAVENAFYDWMKPENCTLAGNITFDELTYLWLDQLKRDGNVFIRKVIAPDTKYGFVLEPLEVDLLDVDKNEELSNGNVVILGIEFNKIRKPVGYWFKQQKMKDELTAVNSVIYNSNNSVRVPAEQIIHYFDRERSNQVIGVTSLASMMLTMHTLEGYEQAAVIAARIGAAKAMVIESENPPVETAIGEESSNNNVRYDNVSYGEVLYLNPGEKLASFNPDYPRDQYPSFIKSVLRKMAAGLGVAYANWVGDLESVNYSSMRGGTIDERDLWKLEHKRFAENILKPIFSEWLKYALIQGRIIIAGRVADYDEYERLNYPEFPGRKYDWVDPLNDVQSVELMLKNNLTTLTEEHAKMGKDFRDYLKVRKREIEALKEIKQAELELLQKENELKLLKSSTGE